MKLPGVRYYWESKTRYSPVADTLTRNRFQKLLTVLHFVDNFSVPDDVKANDKSLEVEAMAGVFSAELPEGCA